MSNDVFATLNCPVLGKIKLIYLGYEVTDAIIDGKNLKVHYFSSPNRLIPMYEFSECFYLTLTRNGSLKFN